MQTPTTAQIRTAMEVLKKLGERIKAHAAHSVMQLPDSDLGADYAARIETRTMEQTSGIVGVVAQPESWRDELQQQRRHRVHHRV
jgi:hypothetical protein